MKASYYVFLTIMLAAYAVTTTLSDHFGWLLGEVEVEPRKIKIVSKDDAPRRGRPPKNR